MNRPPAARPDGTVLPLVIGGLGLRVTEAPPPVRLLLRRRYAAYLGEADSVFDLAVGVLDGPDPGGSADPALRYERGRLSLTAAQFEAGLDLPAGAGWVRASPAALEAAVEYALRAACALAAFAAGGLLFHAAGVVRAGRAYLFFGPSGSGKTTIATLSSGDVVLNDDLVLVRPAADGWVAHSTPFSGVGQVPPSGPRAAPVAALFRLVHGPAPHWAPLPLGSAVAEICAGAPVISADPAQAAALLERARQIAVAVPVGRLSFRRDASFWPLVAGRSG